MADIKRPTTTDLINNLKFSGVATANLIAETDGFTTKGDGGGAQWKLNGVTGQTVSQSPTDLSDALLNDASGNQWALIDSPYLDPGLALGMTTAAARAIFATNGFNIYRPTGIRVNNGSVPDATNKIFVREEITTGTDEATTVQFQRDVSSATATNPKCLRAFTKINTGIDSLEFVVSAELDSDSDAVNGGAAALSAVTIKNGKGNLFAGHFQVKDTQGDISSIGGSMVGQELNIQSNGVDDNAVRIGYDIIARTYQPLFATKGAGEFHAGVRIRNSSLGAEGGKWTNALIIEDGTQAIPNAITIGNSPGTGTGWALEDQGLKARGLDLKGQYGITAVDMRNANLTTSAILVRLKDKGQIEFDTGVSLKWDSTVAAAAGSMVLLGQSTQLTVGAAGAGAALPATPTTYLNINVNGTDFVMPLYLRV